MTRAIEIGLIACDGCELVIRARDPIAGACPRCGERLERRKHRSVMRSLAFLVAATALYWPANTLPIMETVQFPHHRSDTILSGIAFLWGEGQTFIAVLVFSASILVPMLKIAAMATLLVTSARRSTWRPRGRTKLYRVLEIIGHWSMLDVFVVALLTAVVQLGRFGSVAPGPALIPFAGVVVLTMLASAAFDPRAIWDPVRTRSANGRE